MIAAPICGIKYSFLTQNCETYKETIKHNPYTGRKKVYNKTAYKRAH